MASPLTNTDTSVIAETKSNQSDPRTKIIRFVNTMHVFMPVVLILSQLALWSDQDIAQYLWHDDYSRDGLVVNLQGFQIIVSTILSRLSEDHQKLELPKRYSLLAGNDWNCNGMDRMRSNSVSRIMELAVQNFNARIVFMFMTVFDGSDFCKAIIEVCFWKMLNECWYYARTNSCHTNLWPFVCEKIFVAGLCPCCGTDSLLHRNGACLDASCRRFSCGTRFEVKSCSNLSQRRFRCGTTARKFQQRGGFLVVFFPDRVVFYAPVDYRVESTNFVLKNNRNGTILDRSIQFREICDSREHLNDTLTAYASFLNDLFDCPFNEAAVRQIGETFNRAQGHVENVPTQESAIARFGNQQSSRGPTPLERMAQNAPPDSRTRRWRNRW